MPTDILISKVLVLLALAVGLIYFGLRLKMPAIVGFLITGILVGPSGLKLLTDPHQVEALSELGVVLLLFTIGLEFSIQSLLKMKKLVLMGGGLQMGIAIALALPLGMLIGGFPWNEALLYGMLISLSSTAIVLKLLQERGEMDSAHGRGALGVLVFQDLAVVPLVLLVPYMAGKGGSDPFWLVIAKVVIILVLVYILANWVIPWLMLKVSQTRSNELFMFTVALICLGTAFLTERAGLSMALGAFLAGLIIAGSQYAYQAISSVLPMRDVFTSFFFVSIGLRMDIGYLASHPFSTIQLAIGIMIFNLLTTTLAMRLIGLSPRVSVLIGFSLCQVGEFAFVLASMGSNQGLMNDEAMKMFLNITVITMAMTPLSIALGRMVSPKFADLEDSSPPEKAPEAKDHAVVVGFGVAGQAVARACRYICRPYYVIDMNPSSVKNFRKLGEPLFFGDAASEHILLHVHIKEARILVITIPDPVATRRIIAQARSLNPGLHIIARTRFMLNIALLENLGADEVVAEEFEAALRVFDSILRFFGVPQKEREEQAAVAKTADPTKFRLLDGMDSPPPLDGQCNYTPRPKAAGADAPALGHSPAEAPAETPAEAPLAAPLGAAASAAQVGQKAEALAIDDAAAPDDAPGHATGGAIDASKG